MKKIICIFLVSLMIASTVFAESVIRKAVEPIDRYGNDVPYEEVITTEKVIGFSIEELEYEILAYERKIAILEKKIADALKLD